MSTLNKPKTRKADLAARVVLLEARLAGFTAREENLAIASSTGLRAYLRAKVDVTALDREHFFVISLDARQVPIDLHTVAIGSVSQVDVHPREVFRRAIAYNAHSIAVAHNHPSGDPTPSQADSRLTHRLVEAGEILGIPVVDHIILGSTWHSYSYAEQGVL